MKRPRTKKLLFFETLVYGYFILRFPFGYHYFYENFPKRAHPSMYVSVLLNKFVICYLLLQFSTDFYKVWFFEILRSPWVTWSNKNPEKSGIRGEIRDFLSETFYNITVPVREFYLLPVSVSRVWYGVVWYGTYRGTVREI